MNREEVERLLKLAEGATVGPWEGNNSYLRKVGGKNIADFRYVNGFADLAFVAACREAVPSACRELLDAWAERDKAKDDYKACFQAARAWVALRNCLEAVMELETFDEMTPDQQKLDAYIQSWVRMKERAEAAESKLAALSRAGSEA